MTIEEVERVKAAVLRKYRIAAGVALSDVEIKLTNEIDTAAVVGKRDKSGKLSVKELQVNPDFFSNLTFSERVFVLTHEAFHIAFKHFARAEKKPVKDAEKDYKEYCKKEQDPEKRKIKRAILHNKYSKIWNIATDACINALLKKDGLDFPENVIDPKTSKKMQFVDMGEGLHKSAEKIYDYLVKKEREKDKQKENNQNNSNGNNSSSSNQGEGNPKESEMGDLSDIDIDNYKGFDSHENWTDPEEKEKKSKAESSEGDIKDDSKSNTSNEGEPTEEETEKGNSDEEPEKDPEEEIDEEAIFDESKKSTPGLGESLAKIRGGGLNKKMVAPKPLISWRRLLVGNLEKTEEVWGNRRSSKFNPNARIEERTFEKLPNVEVILDTSGSISDKLLKGFLLQLRPIFEDIYDEDFTMKVGCFDTSFYGFQTVRNQDEIMNLKFTGGGGTNFELAATSFSPDPGRQTTKIVFTDGCLGTPQKTRVENIIWIVFGKDMNFTPVGGRIIRVNEKEYKEMINKSTFTKVEEEQSIKKL